MKIRRLSHPFFEIRNDRPILVDPFFSNNPLAPEYKGKPDLIPVTQGHADHSDMSRFDPLFVDPMGFKCSDSHAGHYCRISKHI